MKIIVFSLKFHWHLFLVVIDNNDSALYQVMSWTNDDIVISVGQNELTHWGLVTPFGNIDLGQHWLR